MAWLHSRTPKIFMRQSRLYDRGIFCSRQTVLISHRCLIVENATKAHTWSMCASGWLSYWKSIWVKWNRLQIRTAGVFQYLSIYKYLSIYIYIIYNMRKAEKNGMVLSALRVSVQVLCVAVILLRKGDLCQRYAVRKCRILLRWSV